MKKLQSDTPTRASATREALVAAGLSLFGSKGFEAATTREIATWADTNIASIAYHFGGKEGLHSACADEIVTRLRTVAGPILEQEVAADKNSALQQIEALFSAMIRFLTTEPRSDDVVAFVLRQMAQPSAALDQIYDGIMFPLHVRICQLWSAATGHPAESEQTRLAVFALVGQMLYFRIGRPVVLKRMDWDTYGQAEARKLTSLIITNLRSAVVVARENAR